MKEKRSFAPVVLAVLAGVLLLAMLFPVKVSCGVPNYTCAYLSEDGNAVTSYDIEPLGIMLLESLTSNDFPMQYSSGEDIQDLQ